jgi:hypothetical protein
MKTTTLTVAAAAIVMFAQSASAREYHHRHHHYRHVAASRGTFGQTGSAGPALPNGLFGFAATNAPSIGSYRRTMAATTRSPQRGAAGRCGDWSGLIPVRATTSRATGPIGAGRGPRELALWWCGRITSERSSVNKTANGSSSQATTAMPFAPALARSRA